MNYIIFVVLALINSLSHAVLTDGNGGGGVVRGGRYMTFYSAGVIIDESGAKELSEVPGLEKVIKVIREKSHLSSSMEGKILNALLPSSTREYFDIKPEHFNSEVKKRLTEEYERVTRQPSKGIEIYAVTNSQSRDTFLFPSFYKLSPTEQMAILYHESRWVVNPKLSYTTVVKQEIAFQKFIEDIQNPDKQYAFVLSLNDSYEAYATATALDKKSGVLTNNYELRNANEVIPINMRSLLGEKYLSCILGRRADDCGDALIDQALTLRSVIPNSYFLRFWEDQAKERNIIINYSKTHFKFDPLWPDRFLGYTATYSTSFTELSASEKNDLIERPFLFEYEGAILPFLVSIGQGNNPYDSDTWPEFSVKISFGGQ